MDALLFSEHPVEEAEVAIWDFDAAGFVYCFVQRKLHSLNEMECDCVFETAW